MAKGRGQTGGHEEVGGRGQGRAAQNAWDEHRGDGGQNIIFN
jgi:hypothetical protein